MKKSRLAALASLFVLPLVYLACSGGGGGGSSSSAPTPVPDPDPQPTAVNNAGQGIYNTTWDLQVFESGDLVGGGTFTIDGDGDFTGNTSDGPVSGHVNANGSGTGWTSGGSTGSGSLNLSIGTGSGNWSDSEGFSGTWTATRR